MRKNHRNGAFETEFTRNLRDWRELVTNHILISIRKTSVGRAPPTEPIASPSNSITGCVWRLPHSRLAKKSRLLSRPISASRTLVSVLEIPEICENLPPEKRDELADFARFRIARHQDEKWESIIASDAPRPRLDKFVRESAA